MKKQILVIDDDKDDFGIFYEALKRITTTEFTCSYAESAVKALEILEFSQPHFIFIDYNMPGLNGLQLLAVIGNDKILHSSRKYILSTSITEATRKQAQMLGAEGCVEKADSVEELASRLRKVLTSELNTVNNQ